MSFDSPLLLAVLAVPVLAAAAYVLAQRRTSRNAVVFPNLWVLEAVVPRRSRWRRHVPAALIFLTLVALSLTAARPTLQGTVAARGATVVLVVDVSGSMRATDVKPSRIEAARRAMLAFVDNAPANLRIGVIAFSSQPSVITAPSSDHSLVREGIRSIVPGAPAPRSVTPWPAPSSSRRRPLTAPGRPPPTPPARRQGRLPRSSCSRTAPRRRASSGPTRRRPRRRRRG